jgi:preprotein translocase subunit SecA
MRRWWRSAISRKTQTPSWVESVSQLRSKYELENDQELRRIARAVTSVEEILAATATIASRVLGMEMFDVQLQGALALTDGVVLEMQTGEGKTLAAVPAAVWFARSGKGVHVLTANDYLAHRDAAWMGEIYRWLGLTVAAIEQDMDAPERRAAYGCDVTYATANEVGFDYLRDRLALSEDEQVHRPFAAAVIDEADSILIDEARNPLVIAGGASDANDLAVKADDAVRRLASGAHFALEQQGRDVALTDSGIAAVEESLRCQNLFEANNLPLLTAVQDALHAHALLKRDVDYLVNEGAVLSVDEFKGRVVRDRRWPAGLQTALEIKEGVITRRQGRILGSITIQNLVALYPTICGMTGTAVTSAEEFRDVYGLEVRSLPTHRPIIRVDHPDLVYETRLEKEAAVLDLIREEHERGIPVLVGTASVAESERLSQQLGALPHHVLNARHEEAEAEIVARAGEAGAITISTNMAGRGVDIRLGPGVADQGGLLVIGTNRHESRRIDNQLRGRAGRQGDPGQSQFFVSKEDALMIKYSEGSAADTPDHIQRIAEGQALGVRLFLRKYESVVEAQRQMICGRRQDVLTGVVPCSSPLERLVTLTTIDDLWSDYLAAVGELRAATIWVALSGGDPAREYLARAHAMFSQLEQAISEEIPARLETRADDGRALQRGATWTYLTTDQPFGSMTERVVRGIARLVRKRLST